jgi:DnaJ-class molecular chaperone
MSDIIAIIEQVSPTEVIVQCARCRGYGTLGKGWNDPECPTCKGKGKLLIQVERLPLVKCGRCQGYGTLGRGWHDPVCPSCGGAGCQALAGRWKIVT